MLWYPFFLNLSKNIMLINDKGQKHAKPVTSHGKKVACGENIVTF
jgi:hypothetical protein